MIGRRRTLRVPREFVGGEQNGQPPWDPNGRVAVIINDRFWAGTVTGRPDVGTLRVMADCGVHQVLPAARVYSLLQARGFILGRILGIRAQAAALSEAGRRGVARVARPEIELLTQDLIALNRG